MREESGFEVRVRKLVSLWDRTRQGHTPQFFHAYKFFFLCDIIAGEATPSAETTEVRFFAEHEIPADLSVGRVLPQQIARMFAHFRNPELPTEFE